MNNFPTTFLHQGILAITSVTLIVIGLPIIVVAMLVVLQKDLLTQ